MMTPPNDATRRYARQMTRAEIRSVVAYLNQQPYTAAVAQHRAILVQELTARDRITSRSADQC